MDSIFEKAAVNLARHLEKSNIEYKSVGLYDKNNVQKFVILNDKQLDLGFDMWENFPVEIKIMK